MIKNVQLKRVNKILDVDYHNHYDNHYHNDYDNPSYLKLS